jgi:hypothetical protein
MNIPADTPKSRRQTKLRVMAHPNKNYSPQNYNHFKNSVEILPKNVLYDKKNEKRYQCVFFRFIQYSIEFIPKCHEM